MKKKIQQNVRELLDKMTLQEKIGQLHQEPLLLEKVDEIKDKIRRGEV